MGDGRGGGLASLHRPPADEETAIRVFGNTQGLRATQVRQLERLLRRQLPADRLVTHELARELTELSHDMHRQVGVLVDRRGAVTHAMVGNAHSIELPDWGRMRAGPGRLRGLRCIHTHLGAEGLTRDDLTDLALLRLDAMVSIETDDFGLPGRAFTATLRAANLEGATVQQLEPRPPSLLDLDFQEFIRDLEEELARTTRAREVGEGERALLVSV